MSGRMRKVDEGLRHVLSEAIPTLKDPRIGFVTVTSVETSNDLDVAKVWISVYGNEKQRAATLHALEGAVGPLQARVGRELRLRRTPKLTFIYDRAIEHGVAMTKLIDELTPDDPSRSDSETDLAAVDGEHDAHAPTRSDASAT